MRKLLSEQQEQRFQKLLMKALDEELSGREKQEFDSFISRFSECQKEWEDYKKIKEVTQAMKLKNPPQEIWDMYWMSVYNRLERGLGWILFSIGAIIVLAYGGYKAVESIIADPGLESFLKVAILLLMGGLAILLVSVIREKLFMRKKDPYKEVQR